MPKPADSILKDIEERFRRLLLKRLHPAERLSEEFMNRLLQWNPSGFSVYADELVWDDEPQRLEKLARYLTRAPVRVDGVSQTQDSRVLLTTPPDPLTGESGLLGPSHPKSFGSRPAGLRSMRRGPDRDSWHAVSPKNLAGHPIQVVRAYSGSQLNLCSGGRYNPLQVSADEPFNWEISANVMEMGSSHFL